MRVSMMLSGSRARVVYPYNKTGGGGGAPSSHQPCQPFSRSTTTTTAATRPWVLLCSRSSTATTTTATSSTTTTYVTTADKKKGRRKRLSPPRALQEPSSPPPPPATETTSQTTSLRDLPVLEPLGQGLARDIRRRFIPHLKSDYVDGFSLKTISAAGFLFCACLCVAAAFGASLGVRTGGAIGVTELILGTAFCGMVSALTVGQPVAIYGFGGAHLAFTSILYALSEWLNVSFLPMYSWIGLWTAGLLLAMTLTSVSNLVMYFTRFTDETFSALSASIFVFEAIRSVGKLFIAHGSADVAYLACLCALATYWVVTTLAGFRQGVLINERFRSIAADFAPLMGIVAGTAASIACLNLFGTQLPSLALPATGLSPTLPGRETWLIDIFECPVWLRWASFVPALFASLLLFMDQVITTRLVNSPDNPMRKGHGYHLDLLVVSVLCAICSLVGWPWVTAATLPSLSHVRALSEEDTETGELVSIRENRVSNFLIHFGMGASLLLLRPWLMQVPLSVFMGLFLYLGLSAARNNKFVQRIRLLFCDPTRYAQFKGQGIKRFWARVPPKISNKYTLMQLACFGVLWTVKSASPWLGMAFPIIIALLVPARVFIGRFFEDSHLEVLDDCGDAIAVGRDLYNQEVNGGSTVSEAKHYP